MRRLPRLLIALLAALAVTVPMGAAHAAKPNPWSAYFPAKGVVCTSQVVHAGKTESETTTVLTKSAKKITIRTSGEGRQSFLLKPGGKMQSVLAFSDNDEGMRLKAKVVANYPSPTQLLHHRTSKATLKMTLTMSKGYAKVLLKHGRTLTLTGTYRTTGLGSRTVTLADTSATKVDAIGFRTTLRSLKISNAKKAYVKELRKELLSTFTSANDTEWVAKGRGNVLTVGTDDDGAAETTTQVSCS